MAQRRMFSKKIIETDFFMDMPPTAKLLYFYLNMGADDDGFVSNPKTIKILSGATDDDLKLLIVKQFIIPFESGVVVIKDWKIHNYIQKDRYYETQYVDEKSQLSVDKRGSYTKCIQNVSSGKDRLGKDRLGKEYIVGQPDENEPKPYQEIISFLNEKAGTNFRHSSKATQTKINARLNEGFTVDDFKKVINYKVSEWSKDKNYSKYLRPETLFGAKFEGYLNQGQLKTNARATYSRSEEDMLEELPF